MSMSQFNKWLGKHGVTKGPRCYRIPCKGVTFSAEDSKRHLQVTINTRIRDRRGDILEPGGAQIASFLKNPVVLWAHDYRALPVGRATSLMRDGEALKADVLFAPTDFAREVYQLYAKGFLRAWSVGFLPLEWDVIEDENKRFAGYHVRSWELIELSAVPVPANPEALTNAMQKGLVREPALVKVLQDAISARSVAGRVIEPSEADAALSPAQCGRTREPDAPVSPEISMPDFARALASKLIVRLRPCLGDAVAQEIRRRQGRLD